MPHEEREIDVADHEAGSLIGFEVQNLQRRQTPLLYPIDILPGMPHRNVSGLAAAAEFCE